MLEQKGITAPTAYKTGTTIVGLIYKVKIYLRRKKQHKVGENCFNFVHFSKRC